MRQNKWKFKSIRELQSLEEEEEKEEGQDIKEDAKDPDFCLDSPICVTLIISNKSTNIRRTRSGSIHLKATGIEKKVQTENPMPDRPKLRIKLRTCTDEIKNACAKVSSICGLSAEKSRKVVQIVAKELYNHDLNLTPEEQLYGEEGILAENSEKKRIPVSVNELKNYTYVIPSARTITDFKQIQASEMELDAAKGLLYKGNSNEFLHFVFRLNEFISFSAL